MSFFVNFKVHSVYSLLQSTLSLSKIAELAFRFRQPAVALADTNLFGALEFSLNCVKFGIQPIISCKFMLTDDKLFLKTEELQGFVSVVVTTEMGYKNLLKLISLSENFETYYLVSLYQLESNCEGLIVLMGEIGGFVWQLCNKLNYDEINKVLIALSAFFVNNLIFEVQRHTLDMAYEATLLNFANLNGLSAIATNETYFECSCDYEFHKVLTAISKSSSTFVNEENYFKAYNNVALSYQDLPCLLQNTLILAKRCSFVLEKAVVGLPKFSSLKTSSENEYLYKLSIKGLEYLFYAVGKCGKRAYYKRLLSELTIIAQMGYSGYFLIVADFIMWAKAGGIIVGPGRGSVAGSLIAYCMGITNIDPIEYNLLFERFLNKNRASLPDIDVDFCQFGRENVIRYVQARYGKRCVGQIVTFGTLQLKAAIRDVGRALCVPFEKVNCICKLIPNFNVTQTRIIDVLLANKGLADIDVIKLITMSMKLIGICKHVAVHAAGVVISGHSLVNIVPVNWDEDNGINVVQFNMECVERVGLLKFDFLGLKTLSVVDKLADCSNSNMLNCDLRLCLEKSTFRQLKSGNVSGIFQIETEGMKRSINMVLPNNLIELATLIALYRPGPMKNIKVYADTKHELVTRNFIHNKIDHILDETCGIIVYQEQIMLIAQALSGYTLVEADCLRSAVAKKDKIQLLLHKQRFIQGVTLISRQASSSLFETLFSFADYGFNKSHAIAYSLLCCYTAYFKANFPLEFYAVSMTLELPDSEKLSVYYYEARKLNVCFNLPTVQMPITCFKVGAGYIQYPLNAIKTIGEPVVAEIQAAHANKRFSGLLDFCFRVSVCYLNKRIFASLAYAGALDELGVPRHYIITNLDTLWQIAKTKIKLVLPPVDECAELKCFYEEYQLLGCFVSKLPLTHKNHYVLAGKCRVRSYTSYSIYALKLVSDTQSHEALYKCALSLDIELGAVCECELVFLIDKTLCKTLIRVQTLNHV